MHEREPRKKDATEGVMAKIARRSKEGPARAREQGRADAGEVTQPRTTGCRHVPCTADEEDEVRRGGEERKESDAKWRAEERKMRVKARPGTAEQRAPEGEKRDHAVVRGMAREGKRNARSSCPAIPKRATGISAQE